MAGPKSYFVCQSCGHQSPKWLGRCPDCGTWGSLIEEALPQKGKGTIPMVPGVEARAISDLGPEEKYFVPVGLSELDRVLGGGAVPGGVVLVGGDPGIGKSTLLLQVIAMLSNSGLKGLYVSGEESLTQTKMRADRLGVTVGDLYVMAENRLEAVLGEVERIRPKVLVIDSVQTVYSASLESSPGSISQVRETAARVIEAAKGSGISTFIIGHVTKEGALAGPRALEHLVDTVLYFEGEPGSPTRILRAVKNRFGPTDEIGVFEMTGTGLRSVENPSGIFLSQRSRAVAGSGVIAAVKGTRPLLIEVQALVASPIYGVPRRTAVGVDGNRVALLMAVLEKRAGLSLSNYDLFISLVGGVRIEEPAADLGVAMAIASAGLDRPLPGGAAFFGEVGLTGEVRPCQMAEARVREASRLGFATCYLPSSNAHDLKNSTGLSLVPVLTVAQALESALGR